MLDAALLAEILPRRVELVGNCAGADCLRFAAELRMKIDEPKYRHGVSVMENPSSLIGWRSEHRTARKRADRAWRFGYRASHVDYSQYDQDIYEINTSREQRQGRPMSEGYRNFVQHSKLPDFRCKVHRTITYGVVSSDEKLVAYLTLHRSGELGLVSMILGHGDVLDSFEGRDIMFLLFQGVVQDQAGGGGILYYNRHDSGKEGLRFSKERLGFREGSVEWIL